MTIEIADRLIKLRKKNGYSQEELADKLGLSRQAVSKWERAEASPDTDNLICLAKLYGVSLDELLSTDEDVETIVKEQVKEEDSKKEGIHLVDNDGSEVHITNDGVEVFDKGHKIKKMDKTSQVIAIVEGALTVVALVTYILLGSLLGMWWNMWIVFFVPGIIGSICRVIHKKNLNKLNVAFICCFIYFFLCMVAPGGLWHPLWVIFLAIPLYHSLVGSIRKLNNKPEDDD